MGRGWLSIGERGGEGARRWGVSRCPGGRIGGSLDEWWVVVFWMGGWMDGWWVDDRRKHDGVSEVDRAIVRGGHSVKCLCWKVTTLILPRLAGGAVAYLCVSLCCERILML